MLYLLGKSAFCCRQCARLTYSSRRQDAAGRAWLRQAKAWRRLGVDPEERPGLEELNRPKPKGMHWRTFERLAATIERAEEVHEEAFLRAAGRLLGRMAQPWQTGRELLRRYAGHVAYEENQPHHEATRPGRDSQLTEGGEPRGKRHRA